MSYTTKTKTAELIASLVDQIAESETDVSAVSMDIWMFTEVRAAAEKLHGHRLDHHSSKNAERAAAGLKSLLFALEEASYGALVTSVPGGKLIS
jgi:hypothetical protein